jgi:CRP/FNR family transcriptional regulator
METFESFLSTFRTKMFAKGDIIFVQGQIPEVAYAIKSGIVKSYNLSVGGEEKLIDLHSSYDILPESWVFSGSMASMYYQEAFTNCEMFVIPKAQCQNFFYSHVSALRWFFRRVTRRHIGSMMRVNALIQPKASAKLVCILHVLCLRFGKDIRQNVVKIQLPLTQQDIANLTGLKRETAAIELKRLKDRGIIDYAQQNYIVKTNRLDQLLDEDYEPIITI